MSVLTQPSRNASNNVDGLYGCSEAGIVVLSFSIRHFDASRRQSSFGTDFSDEGPRFWIDLNSSTHMGHRELFPGHFINFTTNKDARHWLGGTQSCEGAWCSNCRLPLMLHLTLDCSDQVLNLDGMPCRTLKLFYCMRCALSWYDFCYRIVSENQIEIIEEFRGETAWEEWYSEGGVDVLERRSLQLSPIPPRLQDLYDRLNANEDLTESEEAEVASFTGDYANPDVGAYPIVDVINQLGGRSFLCQRLDDPVCSGCKRAGFEPQTMYFLASLTNDAKAGVRITFDGYQIVYFLCPTCGTIKVQHSV